MITYINIHQSGDPNIGKRLDKLNSRMDKIGANAAALAALHPLEYYPENQWQFTTGYGHHSNADALAIGTFYRPNQNTMYSFSTSLGGDEKLLNLGFSIKLDKGKNTLQNYSKTELTNTIIEMQKTIKELQAEIKELKTKK